MIWTDTFANNKQNSIFTTTLGENNARLADLNRQDIRIIIGNPPYSVGQGSANDNNQNEHYAELDARIAETYVDNSKAKNSRNSYDSFSRAYRWASDRIGGKGIIGFVTNASFLDSATFDGMRKCLAEEFSSICVYHLKGNQRTSGERSRQEGGKVFGEGSRAPVAIVFLVKNPVSTEHGKIYFHAVDDYLTREEKLACLRNDRSITCVPMRNILPDVHGDWFDFRDDSFYQFIALANSSKDKFATKSLFKLSSNGLTTSRDAWVYNGSKVKIQNLMIFSISEYNSSVDSLSKTKSTNTLSTKIKWSRSLKNNLSRFRSSESFAKNKIKKSAYRPFFYQYVYFDRFWNEYVYSLPKIFPCRNTLNLTICSSGVGSKEFSCLMVNQIPCLDFLEKTQCFPRWLPGEQIKTAEDELDFGEPNEVPSGFSPEALPHFQAAYPGMPMTEDELFYYIYGILHSEDYRTRYANNLMKELPRIPRVATYEQFMAFSKAGRELARLHVYFEDMEPYSGVSIEYTKPGQPSYRVKQMKWGKIKGKTGNAAKDKTTLIYNDWITVKNIPLEAQEYVVNKKSALDWVVERACVSIDKPSGIVNDFNDYAAEMGNERYPLDLFLKVITVSLETMKIVKALPKLEIHPLDQ